MRGRRISSRNCYSTELTFTGRAAEAISEVKQAQSIDPLSSIALEIGAEVYYFARNYDEAIRQNQKAIEMDPSNPNIYSDLGDAYLEKQMCSEAINAQVRTEELSGHAGNAAAMRNLKGGDCLALMRKQLEFYSDPSNPSYYPMSAGIASAMLGERDQAFKFIEMAYKTRQGIIWLKVEPQLDNIRSDPRYFEMLKRIGLADDGATASLR